MIQRLILLVRTFLYFLVLFLLTKICFLLFASSSLSELRAGDFFDVLWHGLPLDISTAAYFTALPWLLIIASIYIVPRVVKASFTVYFAIISFIYACVAIADIVVYPYWGFHIDSSAFLYLQSPKDAMASASALQMLLCPIALGLVTYGIYWVYKKCIGPSILALAIPKSRTKTFGVFLLMGGLLFLCIRGGVTTSTMNVGKVYYSDNLFLNHAAINPHFNLLYSMSKSEKFEKQYQFYDRQKAEQVFDSLHHIANADSVKMVLNSDRPNVIFFILESFSGDVVSDSLIAPNIHRLAKEGISFANFYANSFRTDRGVVSILSGYPTHPTAAIMKYPKKTQSLASIPRKIQDQGYDLSFYYGGDIDFANMRSYYVGSCGIKNVVSDKDFPVSERLTKWGVRDDVLLRKVWDDTKAKEGTKQPFMTTVLTLSSHEPFDVPTQKFDEPFLNSVAYTDSCIGAFADELRKSSLWDNTLLVFVADHCMQSYPQGLSNYQPERYRIPLVWAGGAVKEPLVVDGFASQNDIAATLLSQLKIDYSDFKFSKDVLNTTVDKFAFYAYVNGFSMLSKEGSVIYDNTQSKILSKTGDTSLEEKAKAYFQNMYIDLGER